MNMSSPIIALEEIEAAQKQLAGQVVRTPLVRVNVDDAPADIYLKLENLQPIGSFKLRGASNAFAAAEPEQLANGVYTASAGNMAQGVAWKAKQLGIPCTVIVPDHAPEAKLNAIDRLGAEIIKVTFDDWWQIILSHQYPGQNGLFIHPVSDRAVMAGNGTIGLEIFEDLPDVDAVITPYGGGGLSCGVASALRHKKPGVKCFAAEVETAAPLSAAFAAGEPTAIDYEPSFVDGIGSGSVLDEMWPLVTNLIDASLVVSLAEIEAAVKLILERNRVLAEGAGAAAVAAALAGQAGSGKVVCVVSGGNLNLSKLAEIIQAA
jgi:threonine dehydratase